MSDEVDAASSQRTFGQQLFANRNEREAVFE
jgi:hypothetical protein